MEPASLGSALFAHDARLRYVAVNQRGQVTEMTQNPLHPSTNPTETDRMEELIVNPVVLELTGRRGNLDLGGVRYVIVRYGTQYQLLMLYRQGHLSVGINLADDPIDIANTIAEIIAANTDNAFIR